VSESTDKKEISIKATEWLSCLSVSLVIQIKRFGFCEISLYLSSYNGQIIRSAGMNSDKNFLNCLIELREHNFCGNAFVKSLT
jgi:hypothetical protein